MASPEVRRKKNSEEGADQTLKKEFERKVDFKLGGTQKRGRERTYKREEKTNMKQGPCAESRTGKRRAKERYEGIATIVEEKRKEKRRLQIYKKQSKKAPTSNNKKYK